MYIQRRPSEPMVDPTALTEEEWNRLQRLLAEISANPAAITTREQEDFSALFARSLAGKGDRRPA